MQFKYFSIWKCKMPSKTILASLIIFCFCISTACQKAKKEEVVAEKPKVLLFCKTQKFYHTVIPEGRTAIVKIGSENGIIIDTTTNAALFTENNLKQYKAVVFFNTTGDVLNDAQQNSFEQYIKSGGGFVGIHSATDTEFDWPWYGKLVGAYFTNHPAQQNATLNVVNSNHAATRGLPAEWKRFDEWYNFKDLASDLNVLITIDETSYTGGKNGPNHPMAWYHTYDGGRAFYTALGHTSDSYKDPLFMNHILGGLQYAIGQ